jgi:hypothetical protein
LGEPIGPEWARRLGRFRWNQRENDMGHMKEWGEIKIEGIWAAEIVFQN